MSRDLLLVAISLFAWGVGEASFLPFQTLYLQELGASPLDIGAILSAFGVAGALAHIPVGYLADRIGRKQMMAAAWILGVAAAGVMGWASSLPVYVLGMLAYGVTLFVMAPMNSYVTAARGNWSVARALTLVGAGYHLGAMLGPWLGGLLSERYGYRSIFQFATAIFAFSTLLVLLIRPQPVESDSAHSNTRVLTSNRIYLSFLALLFFVNFAMYLPQPLSPNYLQGSHGLSQIHIGSLYFLASFGVVVLNLVLGQVPARLGFLIAQSAVGLFALLLWRGAGFVWFIPAFFLLGGYRTSRSLATAQVREFVHGSYMGLAYGFLETSSSFAVILAPLLAGFLYNQNPEWVYAVSVGLICLSLTASAAFLYGRPRLQMRATFGLGPDK